MRTRGKDEKNHEAPNGRFEQRRRLARFRRRAKVISRFGNPLFCSLLLKSRFARPGDAVSSVILKWIFVPTI
jgi:hypothetical protein